MAEISTDTLKEASGLIDNLQVVSPTVVRGGQPDVAGLTMLKNAGIKLVVNLRYAAKSAPKSANSFSLFRHRGDDDEIEEEKASCEALGLKFLNISLNGFSAPDIADIRRFVSLFNEQENLPVYVHCLHGKERTGLMLAAYRIKVEGWTAERAYQEMLQNGFDPCRTVLSDALFDYAKESGK